MRRTLIGAAGLAALPALALGGAARRELSRAVRRRQAAVGEVAGTSCGRFDGRVGRWRGGAAPSAQAPRSAAKAFVAAKASAAAQTMVGPAGVSSA